MVYVFNVAYGRLHALWMYCVMLFVVVCIEWLGAMTILLYNFVYDETFLNQRSLNVAV